MPPSGVNTTYYNVLNPRIEAKEHTQYPQTAGE